MFLSGLYDFINVIFILNIFVCVKIVATEL